MKKWSICLSLVSSVFVISACGSSAVQTPVILPSGKQGASVQCTEIGSCYEAAGKACPNGYETVDKSSKTTMEVPSVAQFAYGMCKGQKQQNPNAKCDDTQPTPVPVERTTMLIECKSSSSGQNDASESGHDSGEKANGQEAQSSSSSASGSTNSSSGTACTLTKWNIHRKFKATAKSNSCGLPDADWGNETLKFPPHGEEGSQFVMGEATCSMGPEKILDGGCTLVTVWSCTDPDGGNWTFGTRIEQSGEDAIHGNFSAMSDKALGGPKGQPCISEFVLEVVP